MRCVVGFIYTWDDKDAHTCSCDGYNSSSIANHHFISMLPVQLVESQHHIEEDMHTAVWAVRFPIPTQHTHQMEGRDRHRRRDKEKSPRNCVLIEGKPIWAELYYVV